MHPASRNPRWSSGPPMTSTTMTSPSATRSLMRAEEEPITLKKKACRPVCRRPSVMIERGDPLLLHMTHKFRVFKKFRNTAEKVSKSGFFWIDKESRFSLTIKQIFENTNSKPIMTEKLNETIESQKEEICRAHHGDERLRQDHQLLREQLLKQNWDLRGVHGKSLSEMEELKRFQGSTFDTIARIKLVEDRDTILELTGKIQELQNEIHCMNDREIFKMLNQYAVDMPTLPVNQCLSHLIQFLVECKPVLWECRAAKMGRQAFGTNMENQETFWKSNSVFFSTFYARVSIHGVL